MTTGAANRLRLYHVDVFPGSVKKVRQVESVPPFNDQGNFGRFRFDIDDAISLLHPSLGLTRELLVSLDDGAFALNGMGSISAGTADVVVVPNPINSPTRVKANGFIYGQYWVPWPEYIFPETALSGISAPQANFDCLAFLAGGWSLDLLGNGVQVPIPQIAPWPQSTLPAFGTACP